MMNGKINRKLFKILIFNSLQFSNFIYSQILLNPHKGFIVNENKNTLLVENHSNAYASPFSLNLYLEHLEKVKSDFSSKYKSDAITYQLSSISLSKKPPIEISIKRNLIDSNDHEDSKEFRNFKPDAFWLGYNHNMYNHILSDGKDEFHNSWALEAGVGKYYYEVEDLMNWIIAGGGIGLEYRQLFKNSNNAYDTLFQQNFKPIYLNVRSELGFGFELLDYYFALHLQFGFVSNFYQNYLRPGIGISLNHLQIGYEDYWALNNASKSLQQSGVYFRYIVTFNNWKSEEYKKPFYKVFEH